MDKDKIFELMSRQGKTGKDLAVYLNVTQQTVTNWKIGVSESYKKRLPEIAVFLNTTVEELAGIPIQAEESIFLSRHEIELIQAYRTNVKMQEAVDTLLGLENDEMTEKTEKGVKNINVYTPISGRNSSNPSVAAYGLGSVSLDSKNVLDDPEIDRILKKIKKIKK